MSSIAAAICALAIHVVVLLPLAAGFRISGIGRAIALLYLTVAAGLGLYHTGIFHRHSLAQTNISVPIVGVGKDDPHCAEVLEALDSAGLDADAPNAADMVERLPGWQQVPEAGRELVLACIRQTPDK
jgi:hypothetical protein